MRVVLDTNILVSALIAPAGNPAAIYNAWEQGRFTLLSCAEHLDELRTTLQKPKVADLIKPYKAGRLVNQIKKLAEIDKRENHAALTARLSPRTAGRAASIPFA